MNATRDNIAEKSSSVQPFLRTIDPAQRRGTGLDDLFSEVAVTPGERPDALGSSYDPEADLPLANTSMTLMEGLVASKITVVDAQTQHVATIAVSSTLPTRYVAGNENSVQTVDQRVDFNHLMLAVREFIEQQQMT